MQSQLYSVSKIFSERLFRIPDYQRGYAWTGRQLKDFWNDLVQLEVDKNHYCGVITLEKVNKKTYKSWQDDLWIIDFRSFEPFFVVDGQQRLTTTIVLLQAIIEIFNENERLNYLPISEIRQKFIYESKDNGVSRSYIFGYEKDNPSYEFLKTEIFLENSVKSYMSEETIYTHNLLGAKNYFLDKLKQYEKVEIEILFKKLTQHFLFNIYSISNDIDVFVAFETMNNRGKPLSHLELLKNRLIYLTTKMDLDANDRVSIRNAINDTWKAVYHYLGKNKSKPLDDDTFLKTHFFIYVYPSYKDNLALNNFRYYYHSFQDHQEPYAEFLFDEKFSQKRIDVEKEPLTVAEILKYVESLQKSVIVWYYLHFPLESKTYSKEEKELLEKINRINFNDASPILLVVFSKKTRKDVRLQLLLAIEKILFIESLTYNGDSDVDRDFLVDAIELISGENKIEDYSKRLLELIKNYSGSDKFFNDFRRRIINTNYYEWRGIKYFLYEYEKVLQVQSKNKTQKIRWEEFDVKLDKDDFITVEHIYPRKAVDESWKLKFSDYSLKQRRVLCNSLGNLLALSKPKNSSLQNKPFAEKKENKSNIRYRFGSYSEIEVSLNKDWTPEHILERGILLLNFMEKHWQLKLGNRSQKIELLKLEFLNK